MKIIANFCEYKDNVLNYSNQITEHELTVRN